MTNILNKAKEVVIGIVVGAIFVIVPFYYNTNAAINQMNEKVEGIIEYRNKTELIVGKLQSDQLVGEERHKNIEQRLERIEQKIDRLSETTDK